MIERDDLGDNAILLLFLWELFPCFGKDVLGPGRLGRDDLNDLSSRNSGIALHLKDRFEDPVSLNDADLTGGYDGGRPLYLIVYDKVLSGQLANELNDDPDICIVEVHGNELATLCLLPVLLGRDILFSQPRSPAY